MEERGVFILHLSEACGRLVLKIRIRHAILPGLEHATLAAGFKSVLLFCMNDSPHAPECVCVRARARAWFSFRQGCAYRGLRPRRKSIALTHCKHNVN